MCHMGAQICKTLGLDKILSYRIQTRATLSAEIHIGPFRPINAYI